MKRSTVFSLLIIFALLAAVALSSPQPAVNAAARHPNLAQLSQTAQAQGSIGVLVTLKTASFQPEGSLADAAAAEQRAALRQAQNGVLSRLGGAYDARTLKPYTLVPGMALWVTPAGLAGLAADPAVQSIQEDLPLPPSLLESVALIGAPTVWTSGYSGQGQAVAVLDTGVDKNHPFLAGRVPAEGCFSTTSEGNGSLSLCPGGVGSSSAPDSALPYGTGVCPAGACDHGTHVAGIAAGRDPVGVDAVGFSGVAKDANLIAIQVFSIFPGSYASCGGSPCPLSYSSDQIAGLEYVYGLRSTYAIAAVNMSLGGGYYSNASQADCDTDNGLIKAVIDTLRGANIATVIASGNNGFRDGISAPGCVSSAVSVGSTLDGTAGITPSGTPADDVSPTSNVSTYLNLFAPGRWITSSIPGDTYDMKSGTSMAAPHVAGAWAVLKSKFPNATVTQILNTLVNTGKAVTDTRAGGTVTKPRIRLVEAAAGSFSISGKITTNGTTGIAGVTVSTNSGLITTLTDVNGNYTLAGLIEGSYTVTPTKTGYLFNPLSQSSVNVGPSQSGINFTGTATAFSVSGQVTLSGGGALSGVTLSDGQGHTTLTDASGNYTLSGLAAGSYTLTPSKAEHSFTPANQAVTVGPDRTGINFSATVFTYSISGRVTLSTGFAVAGVTLSDGLGHSTTTDASGNYTLSGLTAGSYTLTPSKAGFSSFTPANRVVSVGPSKTAMDFVGTTPLYTVSGKVTTNGTTGIVGVLVTDGLGRTATTAADGSYSLSGLPAGSYTLRPLKVGFAMTPRTQAVTLSSNQTVNFTGALGGKWYFLPVIRK